MHQTCKAEERLKENVGLPTTLTTGKKFFTLEDGPTIHLLSNMTFFSIPLFFFLIIIVCFLLLAFSSLYNSCRASASAVICEIHFL